MDQSQIFGSAQWVCAGHYETNHALTPDPSGTPWFPILRSHFSVCEVKKATLRVLGLGFFHCYVNGQRISEDMFLPLSTNYEMQENYPIDEKQTGCRVYVPEYDVTEFLRNGENVLALHFGGGWYTTDGSYCCGDHVPYGHAKAIFRLCVDTGSGIQEYGSSTADKIGDSFVKTYDLFSAEHHDYTDFDDACFGLDYDDSAWKQALPAKPMETEYLFTDCPADRLLNTLEPVILHKDGDAVSYDSGLNCAAIPVLKLTGKPGDKVTVIFAEERNADGTPDLHFHYHQTVSFVCGSKDRTVMPLFTWFAFRYFTVTGPAEVVCVREVHTNAPINSDFTCDNETVNWLYKAYLNTQLSNLHTGIPSDCPHIERKGYTGDGQLTCHAVMDMVDAESFYRKWMGDISDCQDIYTGHVQYTAPYFHCGGGPGGWGCAIVEVPYQFYKHYGDTRPLRELYAQMLRYFDYLEAHSVNNLVTSDKPGNWCLGDWCTPDHYHVSIPAPMVNNYFYIRSLERMVEIAKLVGREVDIPTFEKRIAIRKEAIVTAYYFEDESNFVGNIQGANAFAIDLGLGDERTYQNLVGDYCRLGHYDTGIFGTTLVTKVLFEHGDGDLAMELMASDHPISFAGMRRAGATTLWENWPQATWDRSRNHPMFGGVSAFLFDYILGIQQTAGTAGYTSIEIKPSLVKLLNRASGYRTLSAGKVSVSYEKQEGFVDFTVEIPENLPAVFKLNDFERKLKPGVNKLHLAV